MMKLDSMLEALFMGFPATSPTKQLSEGAQAYLDNKEGNENFNQIPIYD